jgi:hypothetical protein
VVVDLVTICDLGVPDKFSATTKYYLPANFRIILAVLGDGATFGVEQEHFPKGDLTWWFDVTMLTYHEKRSDTCRCQMEVRCHN